MTARAQSASLRAIDLYAGIGGWSLGLRLAGIGVVGSFEWWPPAAATHEANFGTHVSQVDIRDLAPETLPRHLDLIVGSPPCTQFSFANRGGNGDIQDGLRDVEKFLEIVAYAEPAGWVMENVPRVAGILERELGPGGRLERFKHLVTQIAVVDMADFGLPQRRSRMLAGDFPLGVLESYRGRHPVRTLGDVVEGLAVGDPVVDPIFGTSIDRWALTENEHEPELDAEETRMNRDAKTYHPVYNVMRFPDPLDRTARTVTALCTRVSRESIVIQDDGVFRRLTVRERASLQGFPITFQFFGKTHQSKIKMIGNAFPPPMAYYVAKALLGTPAPDVKDVSDLGYQHPLPTAVPPVTIPDVPRRRFPRTRRFRAAVPNLRFGSGTRFELVNFEHPSDRIGWRVQFSFGTSKAFKNVPLTPLVKRRLQRLPLGDAGSAVEARRDAVAAWAKSLRPAEVQAAWSHSAEGLHPFAVVDTLGDLASQVHDDLLGADSLVVEDAVLSIIDPLSDIIPSAQRKLRARSRWILAGLYVGCWFNQNVRP